MRRVTHVHPAGSWPAAEAVASVTLDYVDRYRRRFRMADDAGADFLLDLAEATRLGSGDGLALDGGGYIRVHAADEAVADLRCATPVATAKLVWHIGNRHVPLQVLEDCTLRIRDDHVIVALAERHGAAVERHAAPFAPEQGAYAGGGPEPGHGGEHDRGHRHGHGHGHDHSH
jgi:urease accessory protein